MKAGGLQLFSARLTSWVEQAVSFIGLIAILPVIGILFGTVADAFGRYLLNRPIAGVVELNETLLVVLVFLGLAWTQATKGHVRVEVLISRLSGRSSAVVEIFVLMVMLAFTAAVMVQGWTGAMDSWRLGETRWGAVAFPIWWAKYMIPFGCFFLCLRLVFDLASQVSQLKRGGKDKLSLSRKNERYDKSYL